MPNKELKWTIRNIPLPLRARVRVSVALENALKPKGHRIDIGDWVSEALREKLKRDGNENPTS